MSRRKKTKCYAYTKFGDLKSGDSKVNLIGLIAVCDSPGPSRDKNAQHSFYFELVDESNTILTGTMHIEPSHESLPLSPSCGDIFCLRRVALEEDNGDLVIKTSSHTTWLLFNKKDDYVIHPSERNRVGLSEKNRVARLKEWALKQGIYKGPPNQPRPPKQPHLQSPTSRDPRTRPGFPSISQQQPSLPPHSMGGASASASMAPVSMPAPMSYVCSPMRARYYDTPIRKIDEQVVGHKESAVIGVLKYFKPPTPSKGNDCFTVLCLVDETHGMSCVLFHPHKYKLPVPCGPGEIVMIKGMVVNNFQGNPQGRGHEHSLVGIFSPMAPPPDKIGDWYEMKANEKTRIQQLKAWLDRDRFMLLNSKLEDLSCANYCSTVCMVVRVSVDRHGALVLTVCDGTKPKSCLADYGPLTTLTSSHALDQDYLDISSMVAISTIFRPHVVAGDVVHLLNLSMIQSSRPALHLSDVPTEVMELAVRDNQQYPGAVNILPSDSPVVIEFIRKLPKATLSGQLSTLIMPDGYQTSTLDEIKQAAEGSIHVVEVHIVGVEKRVCSKLEDICQLRCCGCKSLYTTPHPEDPEFDRYFTAGDACVCCAGDDILEPNRLEYMYGLILLAADHTSQHVELAVSGEEGKRFFSGVELQPTNLHVDAEAKSAHETILQRMTGGIRLFGTTEPLDSAPTNQPTLKVCVSVCTSAVGSKINKVTNTTLCNL